jgi:hypothetical protein
MSSPIARNCINPEAQEIYRMRHRLQYLQDKYMDAEEGLELDSQGAYEVNDDNDATSHYLQVLNNEILNLQDEMYAKINTLRDKSQWKGEGCMGAVLTREMMEIACLLRERPHPTRKPDASSPLGWTDAWVKDTDPLVAKWAIEEGILKPKHGDAIWWLEKSDSKDKIFFWHGGKGVMLPSRNNGITEGDVPADLINFKKAGAYRDFDPPIKHE